MAPMTDAEKLAALTELITTFAVNRDSEDGDKFLSDSDLAMQAAEAIALDDCADGAIRDGWITGTKGGA